MLDRAETTVNRAREKKRLAEEKSRLAEKQRSLAEETMYHAKRKLGEKYASRPSRQEAAATPPRPSDSAHGMAQGSSRTTRRSKPNAKTAVVTPDQWPEELNFEEPFQPYDDQTDERSAPFCLRRYDNQRSHSPSPRKTDQQTQFEHASPPRYVVVEERRPPGTVRESMSHNKPDDHDTTSWVASRETASTEGQPSHRPRSRHPTLDPYNAHSLDHNTSHAPEMTLRPVSSRRDRTATVASSNQRLPYSPVPEVPRSRNKPHTGYAETQRTADTYNRTRRTSPHLEIDALRRPEQNEKSAVKSSQVTETLYTTTSASRTSTVPAKCPPTQNTKSTQQHSTRTSTSRRDSRPRGSRRRRDTLGMSFDSDPRSGY